MQENLSRSEVVDPAKKTNVETALADIEDVERGGKLFTDIEASANIATKFEKAFPVDTTPILRGFLRDFSSNKEPITVSFRQLVPWVKPERATHYIHSYPAKLLPQIAHFFVAAQNLVEPGGSVLDPFAGTGTVALETILSNRTALYADANPLARLITDVKTTPLGEDNIEQAIRRVKDKFQSTREGVLPDVININHWYEPDIIAQLGRLKVAINVEADRGVKNLLQLTFSSTAKKVSLADPRFSVPVRSKFSRLNNQLPRDERDEFVWNTFASQYAANRLRMRNFFGLCPNKPIAMNVGSDARKLLSPQLDHSANLDRLADESIDLVITSPPYAGAQKYIRSSSLSLGWLGLAGAKELKPLENLSIGREHYLKSECQHLQHTGLPQADLLIEKVFKINQTRAKIAANYLIEMRDAVSEMGRVIKPGGFVVLIIGDNEVCGHVFETSSYLTALFEEVGFIVKVKLVDNILSRGLITKRHHTAGVITREWVIVLEKGV
ncbi:hypothetical protein [Methylorubrum sp. GM97]|uniref:hypothetical protein n=1 Tax=Methylorubrum sp. GM97 TaxID=2938232 RepID=UPI002189506F|nr:hypothetical protein [Methylorubrum sp. GM97]BDL37556.1 hypothetical protein MSPGM_01460 [Methylorubrum sp. GM97]